MPELPEVITTSSGLNKKIKGAKITGFWTDWPKVTRWPTLEKFKKEIQGKKILKVYQRGKNVLFDLTGDLTLLVHQKISGHLLLGKWQIERSGKKFEVKSLKNHYLSERINGYIRAIFYLNKKDDLGLSDLRRFAKIILAKKQEIDKVGELIKLGPQALDKNLTLGMFKKIIKKSSRPIKQVLMDQNIISGIGNIYSDEILWQAKINPFISAQKLKDSELKSIYQAIKKVLSLAIRLRGTSTSDYRDPEGKEGGYQKIRKVYQRTGEKCPRCGHKIERKKLGGRSAHFCPNCQKVKI